MKFNIKTLLTITFSILCINLFAQDETTLRYGKITYPKLGMNYYKEYISANGYSFKIGDKIKIGFPSQSKTFTYLQQGDGILTPQTPLDPSLSGKEVEIKKIFVHGNKRIGYDAYLICKGYFGYNIMVQVENSISQGEILTNILTSDQALEKLKKEKDKLDLGIITQTEYDSVRAILVPMIR